MSLRHFLTLSDLTKQELEALIKRASELRKMQHAGEIYQPFVGRTLGMIFEKSSTRTRISFETGMGQFGGSAIFLSPNDTQLGRGEPLEDSARVISSMVDIIMIRTFGHEKVETFDYEGHVRELKRFTDGHPAVMQPRIDKLNWEFDYDITENRRSGKDKTKAILKKYFGVDTSYRNYEILKNYSKKKV